MALWVKEMYIDTHVLGQFNLRQAISEQCDNLNTPADADLRRCASVLFCYLENSWVAEDLTLGQRTVPFKHDSLLTTVLDQLIGLLERMVLHLTGQIIFKDT